MNPGRIKARAELIALAGGSVLGLSVPGFNQWYLGWFGLAILFLLIDGSRSPRAAAWRGWLFGFAYNLVWLNWFLKLNPPQWVGVDAPIQLVAIAVVCWVGSAALQACVQALAALAIRLMIGSGRLAPVFGAGRSSAPAVLTLPLIWCLIICLFGNQPDLLVLPMSSLEYSQHQILPLVQICSTVGGIGLQFMMVAHNVALAVVAASLPGRPDEVRSLAGGLRPALVQWLVILALLITIGIWGSCHLQSSAAEPAERVSIIQAGLMFETERRGRTLRIPEALALAVPMLKQNQPGLAVWTETSLPMLFDTRSPLLDALKDVAMERHLDIVFGVEEQDRLHARKYNAAAGILSNGAFASATYRKRYLIPFGEFEPLVLRLIPESLKAALKLPAVPPYRASAEATVLNLSRGTVAPLICGENADPGLCARSVRNGGQVITNISNLSWFQNSSLGELTIAMAVFRAVENRRYYIYAADTGPSFLIDPYGHIVAQTAWGEVTALTGRFSYLSELTWFSRLCP